MRTHPFPAALVTKLVAAFAGHVVACLGFLYDYSALVALCEVVFRVEDEGLVFCTFALVLKVHALFTKLVLALKTLIRLILNHRNDSLAIFIGTHLQERVIGYEIELLNLIKKLSGFLVKRLEERGLLINIG